MYFAAFCQHSALNKSHDDDDPNFAIAWRVKISSKVVMVIVNNRNNESDQNQIHSESDFRG